MRLFRVVTKVTERRVYLVHADSYDEAMDKACSGDFEPGQQIDGEEEAESVSEVFKSKKEASDGDS